MTKQGNLDLVGLSRCAGRGECMTVVWCDSVRGKLVIEKCVPGFSEGKGNGSGA